jgi:hypothetical protein
VDDRGGGIGDVERVEHDVARLPEGVEVLGALRESARDIFLVASVRKREVVVTWTVQRSVLIEAGGGVELIVHDGRVKGDGR